jgi:hypothetical protein
MENILVQFLFNERKKLSSISSKTQTEYLMLSIYPLMIQLSCVRRWFLSSVVLTFQCHFNKEEELPLVSLLRAGVKSRKYSLYWSQSKDVRFLIRCDPMQCLSFKKDDQHLVIIITRNGWLVST